MVDSLILLVVVFFLETKPGTKMHSVWEGGTLVLYCIAIGRYGVRAKSKQKTKIKREKTVKESTVLVLSCCFFLSCFVYSAFCIGGGYFQTFLAFQPSPSISLLCFGIYVYLIDLWVWCILYIVYYWFWCITDTDFDVFLCMVWKIKIDTWCLMLDTWYKKAKQNRCKVLLK